MKKLFVLVEKPSVASALKSQVEEIYPDWDITFACIPIYALPRSEYPRGLSWSEYPIVREPAYTNVTSIPLPIALNLKFKIRPDVIYASYQEMACADEILCACDFDHNAAVSTDAVLNGIKSLCRDKTPVMSSIRLLSLSEKALEETFSKKGLFYDDFKDLLAYGKVKQYFDWNWYANATVIFGKFLYETCPIKDSVITKYALQLLYFINENNPSDGQAIHAMGKWGGTGAYQESVRFGTLSSQVDLIESLINFNLVERGGSRLILTHFGHKLISELHKDTKDFDLSARLHQWCNDGLEISKPKIDQYIRTMFGKNKRKFNKLANEVFH